MIKGRTAFRKGLKRGIKLRRLEKSLKRSKFGH